MVSVSNVLHLNNGAEKLAKAKKTVGGAALGGIFSLAEFITVPGAFSLDYNTKGEKVEGTNWKSGLKELGKCAIKCLSYLAVPAAIAGLASGAGIVVAGLAAGASFGSTFVLSKIFDELLPSEQQQVVQACKDKGIDITDQLSFLDKFGINTVA